MNEIEFFENNIFLILDKEQIGYLHAKYRVEAGLVSDEYKGTFMVNPLHPLQFAELVDFGLVYDNGVITQLTKYLISKLYSGMSTHYITQSITAEQLSPISIDITEMGERIKRIRQKLSGNIRLQPKNGVDVL